MAAMSLVEKKTWRLAESNEGRCCVQVTEKSRKSGQNDARPAADSKDGNIGSHFRKSEQKMLKCAQKKKTKPPML